MRGILIVWEWKVEIKDVVLFVNNVFKEHGEC